MNFKRSEPYQISEPIPGPFTRAVVFEASHHEVEKLIGQVYGHPVLIAVMEETGNDTVLSFNIGEDDKLFSRWDVEELEAFKAEGQDGSSVSLRQILVDLNCRGLIEPGKYYISVSW